MKTFSELEQKYRLILIKGQKLLVRRVPKNQRQQGRGYRSHRIA